MKPRLLDLFCGAGGAAMGYHRAGFEVVGVDIEPQPRYPFKFWQTDAMKILREGWPLDAFDVVHASPPCQHYSTLRTLHSGRAYADSVPQVLATLTEWGEAADRTWVIENVPGAPLPNAVTVCGSSLGLGANGRHLRRHRLFASNRFILVPPCSHFGFEALGVYGHGSGAGRGFKGNSADSREAMGITWARRSELTQAIPPAYTELIGHQLLCHV